MKKIIITGSTSMLGIALANEFIKTGAQVVAMARPGSERKKSIPASESVRVMDCSLEEIGKLPSFLKGKFDAFYHLGWADTDKPGRNDAQKQKKNIDYTLKAVEAAGKLGCKVFIGAGSQAEYGRYNRPISEDFETRPETAYGRAKLEAGRLSAEMCAKLKIKHVWTRIFSAYGPNDSPATMVMYCIGKMLKHERVSLTACTQTWDYIYCTDAVKAIILAAEKGKDGAVYNVGSGAGQPLKKYVNIISDIIGGEQDAGFGDIKTPDTGLLSLEADIAKISSDTGFLPSIGFNDGIRETIKWYRENIL